MGLEAIKFINYKRTEGNRKDKKIQTVRDESILVLSFFADHNHNHSTNHSIRTNLHTPKFEYIYPIRLPICSRTISGIPCPKNQEDGSKNRKNSRELLFSSPAVLPLPIPSGSFSPQTDCISLKSSLLYSSYFFVCRIFIQNVNSAGLSLYIFISLFSTIF